MAETEDPFRFQLQELKQGRNELCDLEYAFQIQLKAALEASQKQASASPGRGFKGSRSFATSRACVDLTTEGSSPEASAHRKLLESQVIAAGAQLGIHRFHFSQLKV